MEYMGYRSELTEEYMAEFCENLIEAIEEYDTEKEIQKVCLDIEDFENSDFDDCFYLYADKCETFAKSYNIGVQMLIKGYDGIRFTEGNKLDFENSFVIYDRKLPTKSPFVK